LGLGSKSGLLCQCWGESSAQIDPAKKNAVMYTEVVAKKTLHGQLKNSKIGHQPSGFYRKE